MRSASLRSFAVILALAAALLALPDPLAAQPTEHSDITVFGTSSGGGALATDYDFSQPITVSESLCAGGLCLYSATNPGFVASSVGEGSLAPLQSGTVVGFEVVSLDPGVSVKIDATVLDAPGESATLGAVPGLHNHPEWQVTRPEGERGEYRAAFRLIQVGGTTPYASSSTCTLRLGDAPLPTPSPAATATPTASVTPRPTATVALPESLVLRTPRARGDQLVFYYDARDGFTTFVNLANEGEDDLEVALLFYGPDVAVAFEQVVSLAAGTTRTIDVGGLRGTGLPAQAGIALATARAVTGAAIVSRTLAGSFTVANLRTQSAWGGPAPARLARSRVNPASLPSRGSVIDGSGVLLEQIQPATLDLAVYYDPDTLQPAADGGNQLVFVSFADAGDATGAAVASSFAWNVGVTRNDGTPLASRPHRTSGVEVSDLVAVGGPGVAGAAGSMRFAADGSGANRLIFFTQSLGTFATGYLLPALDADANAGDELRSPAPRGDQLLLHYDARDGYTTFLNLANQGVSELAVRIALHPPDLGAPFVLERTLPAGATRTIDVGALRAQGLAAEPGIALVTAVSAGEPVVSRALAGSFTVANLATTSAWGAPAAARAARAGGSGPALGTPIDGSVVTLQAFAPREADLAVFYDPESLAPADLGGNQVVLVAFDGAGVEPTMGDTTWRIRTTRNDGSLVSDVLRAFGGVTVQDLGALAGKEVDGAAGRMHFRVEAEPARNRLVYFVESLGTFATGYLLPDPDAGD